LSLARPAAHYELSRKEDFSMGISSLVLGLAAATAATDASTSRLQLTFGGSVGYSSLRQQVTGTNVNGTAGSVLTLFLRKRLVDDGTPLSLQPFLQRRSTLQLDANGGGFVTKIGLAERLERRGSAGVGFDGYTRGLLAVRAAVGVTYFTTQDRSPRITFPVMHDSLRLPISVGLGLRSGAARIGVAYAIAPQRYDGVWRLLQRWNLSFDVRTVLARRIDLEVGGNVAEGIAAKPSIGRRASNASSSASTAVSNVGPACASWWWRRATGK
jgi:hypothetical protein